MAKREQWAENSAKHRKYSYQKGKKGKTPHKWLLIKYTDSDKFKDQDKMDRWMDG